MSVRNIFAKSKNKVNTVTNVYKNPEQYKLEAHIEDDSIHICIKPREKTVNEDFIELKPYTGYMHNRTASNKQYYLELGLIFTTGVIIGLIVNKK